MSSALYRRFLAICKKWPVDETKAGRDYGQAIRDQFEKYFIMGETSTVENHSELDGQLSALERLADDYYFKKYADIQKSSASGLEASACKSIVSTEVLMGMQQEEDSTITDRLRQSLKMSASSISKKK